MKYEDVTITTCGSMDFVVVQWYFPVYTFNLTEVDIHNIVN